MSGKTIGMTLNNGFAGSYARNPEMMIMTRPNNGTANIVFGSPLMRDDLGGVVPVDSTLTAELFEGVASKEIKTALSYLDQSGGGAYAPSEPVSVFQRGSINVLNPMLDADYNKPVYVRIVADGTKKVGDFEATASGASSIAITWAQWGGKPDANGVAELVLLRRYNA